MRNALTTMVGMAFLLATACGGTKGASNGSNGSGTGATGGTCSAPGISCGSDDQCCSNVCGIEGTGNCCAAQCEAQPGQPCSVPTGCDDMGRCMYPVKGTSCGTTCHGSMVTADTCDGAGGCSPGTAMTCDGGLACGATDCNTFCGSDGGCAIGYFCAAIDSNDRGTCAPTVPNGTQCKGADDCSSGVCGGNGLCCAHACPNDGTPECVANGCSDGGACLYPPAKTVCDTANETCPAGSQGNTLYAGYCDGMGDCIDAGIPCPDNYACSPFSPACVTSCEGNVNCAKGFYCATGANSGACLAQFADGGCSFDAQCLSGVCGTNGTGNCCAVACNTSNGATCAATGCDGTTEDCIYPDAGTSCGVAVSCNTTTNIQGNPAICDGQGNCPKPGTTHCMPFICDGNGPGDACFTTCTDATSCVPGDFCDPTAGSCCGSLVNGTVTVDAAVGKDAACCGIAPAAPCATITYAMKLIDASRTKNVGITAAVHSVGGDWTSAGEVYPIVLGWGVELAAPGVNFYDPNSVGAKPKQSTAIFDIKAFSNNDTVGYASIVGTAASPVGIGMNTLGSLQSTDKSAIQVESGNTLYLAAASVNGSAAAATTAITVVAGGTLTLGEDEIGTTNGTVAIGSSQAALDGWNGIVCGSAGATQTCTINDVAQPNSGSSLTIANQEFADIDAEDGASISLVSFPTIGVAPGAAGFGKCISKVDASKDPVNPAAILLHGMASLTFAFGGDVQCISGQGFRLTGSTVGTPTLTLAGLTIQNTEVGVFASAGSATITNSNFWYNYNGVEQATDGTNIASINLGGGGNQVICSSEKESVVANQMTPGVNVLNTTTSTLDANDVAWDTAGPDVFMCNGALTSCTCEITNCTNTAGADDMDAVYETAAGLITTAGNTVSMVATNAGCK